MKETHKIRQYLQSKNLSGETIKNYLSAIDFYNEFLLQRGKTAENATKKDLLDYLNNPYRPVSKYKIVVSKQISNNTKQHILGTLNHYYNYLLQAYGTENITRLIKIRGVKRQHLRHLFTSEQLEQLCDALYYEHKEKTAFDKPDLQQQKDYILLTLAVYQGLTLGEIRRLEKDDFDFRKATVNVHKSRKANARILSLDATQTGLLMLYFQESETANFVTSVNYVNSLHRQLRKLCNTYENLIQLRSSRINIWIKTYGLRKAQYLAGHRYISSTEAYLNNDFESLQNDMDNFHPLQ